MCQNEAQPVQFLKLTAPMFSKNTKHGCFFVCKNASHSIKGGRHTFEKWAKDANAIRKVNGLILCNVEAINQYITENCKLDDLDDY